MARTRNLSFFFYLALALLMVTVLGFAPVTEVGVPERFAAGFPAYILVHGLVLSTWFALLPLQTVLVARGKTGVHRTLGLAGVGVAIAVIVTGAVTTMRVIPKVEAIGVPLDGLQGLFVGNSLVLAVFTGLFIAAIWKRRSPAVHKRLMVLASCAAIAPALTTNRMLGNVVQSVLPDLVSPLVLFWLLMIGSMTAYDLIREGALNSATKLGLGLLALGIPFYLTLLNTRFGLDYTHWLSATFIH